MTFSPCKALGQHFLVDPSILERVASATGPLAGVAVIEVGPGPGGLTRALLEAGAAPVIAIEKDARFAAALRAWPESQSQRLIVVEADACNMDWSDLLAINHVKQARIIANLPYNVATRLLSDWVRAQAWRTSMALMLQKEVALRICAGPGRKDYGRLSVLVAARLRARLVFSLPPGAFHPPPKVNSALVLLEPLSDKDRFADMEALETIASAAFSQRRKMLRKALRPLLRETGQEAENWLARSGLDPAMRAEDLDQDGFRVLALAFRQAKTGN